MKKAYVAGTFDTKAAELAYLADRLTAAGVSTCTVDLGTRGDGANADIAPRQVAAHHPDGERAVLGLDDRGQAVAEMAVAFEAMIKSKDDVAGIIGAGGSGGTALVSPAMRALPVGVPKVMVSTVASGNVAPYVGPADIAMIYSVTDVQGLNPISRRVLGNAAHALAGMILHGNSVPDVESLPAIALTMFGVTTPCVQSITTALQDEYECLVFHATGTGGQSMEKLVDSKLVRGVVDITTTEIADLLVGGVLSAGEDRLGAIIRSGLPYVGSCGALDMVNFGARETVPERFADRQFYIHNPQVTLMRTTVEENRRIGRWVGERLNRMEGPVRFLIPEGGVSLIDVPDAPFHDPDADAALFDALEETVDQNDRRRLVRLPCAINDDTFAAAAVSHFREIIQ